MQRLRRDSRPFWRQIEAILRDQIVSGEFRPGDRIPSEGELSAMFRVSRPTIRQALDVMALDGMVTRQPGRGTFVSAVVERQPEPRVGLALDALIAFDPAADITLYWSGVVRAPLPVREALALPDGSDAFSFIRIVSFEGNRIAATKVFLPLHVSEELREEDLVAADLLEIIADRSGIGITEVTHAMSAILAAVRPAEQLGVSPGAAVLSICRVSYDRGGAPVERSETLLRNDRTVLEFSRHRAAPTDDWKMVDAESPVRLRGAALVETGQV
jgi:GntR family transcriptional regulator